MLNSHAGEARSAKKELHSFHMRHNLCQILCLPLCYRYLYTSSFSFFPHVCDGVAICVRAASHPTGITPYRPSQNERSKGKVSYDCERARLKRLSTGFVNFVPAAAYYFWTALLCSLFSPYSLHLSTI